MLPLSLSLFFLFLSLSPLIPPSSYPPPFPAHVQLSSLSSSSLLSSSDPPGDSSSLEAPDSDDVPEPEPLGLGPGLGLVPPAAVEEQDADDAALAYLEGEMHRWRSFLMDESRQGNSTLVQQFEELKLVGSKVGFIFVLHSDVAPPFFGFPFLFGLVFRDSASCSTHQTLACNIVKRTGTATSKLTTTRL